MADDVARDLRKAYRELRTLPLGGRGHLADTCLSGAEEIEQLREANETLTSTLRRARRWLLAAQAQATGGRRSTIEGHIRDVDEALRG